MLVPGYWDAHSWNQNVECKLNLLKRDVKMHTNTLLVETQNYENMTVYIGEKWYP